MPNTALKLDVGRQSPLTAEVAINFANIADATAVKVMDMPYGAVVTGGLFIVDEVFNVATTATANIGDLTTPARYLSAVNLKALGVTPLVVTGYLSDGDAIYLVPTNAGAAATTGKARLILTYIIRGRAGEVQPN